ncbi:ribonuclease H-like domain-containing protein [Tanacetum coccineum]
MYDKKNNVLFTDTKCVVLSSDFKLLDESQVLLRVSRKDNMYNVDLRNVVPQGGLTCLFAKATLYESNLWHRRLGHVNFKTMNKLVKGNLARGLPTKIYENDHTCVACQKGKQHKAYCKTKTTQDPPFSSSSKDSPHVGFKPSREEEKKDAKDPENEDSDVLNTEEPRVSQKKDENVNSSNNINTISLTVYIASIKDNDVDENIVYGCADDPNMPNLEDTGIFGGAYDDQDFVVGGDMNNLESSMPVSPIATTRVHKDHPIEQIIGDLHSVPQIRRMTKNSKEHGLVSLIKKQRRTNHKYFQNCLFACFLSQVEPKKVIQALTDPSWIEAMQNKLLHFKLQKVWTLFDLPYGKRAIRTKWVYKNKKYERGIMVRNKARLVAQGYTQEEGIDYDKIDDGIFISQDKYVDEILKKFGFSTVKTASTPMETSKPLMKDENAKDVDVHLYRSMIGSLMYLTSSRPDILFAILERSLGLWYPKDSPFDLEAYTDSDYAGASLDRKSTTGGCQFHGGRLISWQCKKQTIVANSTTKA